MKPIRIQRKRTKGWRMPPDTIYVGRPSKWGNPFIIGSEIEGFGGTVVVKDQETAKGLYKVFLSGHFGKSEIQKELRGKNLSCYCRLDKPCHADVLLELANNL